jgi:imidazole glycerol-phosphate synthase subunit HisF
MLKLRVMPTLLYKDLTLVKGVGFDSWRRVGSVLQAIKVYNMREVDELVFLDITATREGRRPDFQLIDDFADECFMPLTVGGGISTVDDIRRLLQVGADKVALNSAAVDTPELITESSMHFGSQCIVVSIDYRKNGNGGYEVYTRSGTQPTGLDPVEFARRVESLGAGEILLTSIDRDGTMTGYDVELTKKVVSAVSIPVIGSGGAGNYEDMAILIEEAKVAAVAAASIYHFSELTPLGAKQHLKSKGVRIRI